MADANPAPERLTSVTAPPEAVRVRMYRQGLGDCFLISIPRSDGREGYAHVLIDCGVLAGTAGGADSVSGLFRMTMWNQSIPARVRGRMAGLEMISYSTGEPVGNVEAGAVASIVSVPSLKSGMNSPPIQAIVDVEISYPMDLTTQMLEYAKFGAN